MAFSNVPRLNMDDSNEAIKRIQDYLIKQRDELEYKFMHLDSENVYEIDANVTAIKNLDLPLGDNVITEVIHQQVINVETAHILNAWIKNLFVEYLETNFDALVYGDPRTIRNYIRVINEQISFITAELDPNTFEPLLIPDPNGSDNRINVYYTAIGDHVDAYRYFTITNPKLIHKDLTESEVAAFRVLVKKTIKESVKKSILFVDVTTESGLQTVAPVNVEGEGTDLSKPYGERRGQFIDFKDTDGKTFKQFCENNDEFTGLKFTESGLQQYNQFTKRWMPLAGSMELNGIGGVMFWKDKTEFTAEMFQNANLLHYGYASDDANKIKGKYSTFFPNTTYLGAEIVTERPPIQKTLYKLGTEFVPFVSYNKWTTGNKAVVQKQPDCLYIKSVSYNSTMWQTKEGYDLAQVKTITLKGFIIMLKNDIRYDPTNPVQTFIKIGISPALSDFSNMKYLAEFAPPKTQDAYQNIPFEIVAEVANLELTVAQHICVVTHCTTYPYQHSEFKIEEISIET